MKHVLLTGAVQVGKSTALRMFLEKSGYSADGYRTFWHDDKTLYIAPYGHLSEGIPAAVTHEGKRSAVCSAFDSFADVIKDSGKKQLIVFDELGRLEQCSEKFMNAVFEKLQGEKTVLGVIKKESNSFLDKIRSLPNIVIIEVTEENRDFIPYEIAKYISL